MERGGPKGAVFHIPFENPSKGGRNTQGHDEPKRTGKKQPAVPAPRVFLRRDEGSRAGQPPNTWDTRGDPSYTPRISGRANPNFRVAIEDMKRSNAQKDKFSEAMVAVPKGPPPPPRDPSPPVSPRGGAGQGGAASETPRPLRSTKPRRENPPNYNNPSSQSVAEPPQEEPSAPAQPAAKQLSGKQPAPNYPPASYQRNPTIEKVEEQRVDREDYYYEGGNAPQNYSHDSRQPSAQRRHSTQPSPQAQYNPQSDPTTRSLQERIRELENDVRASRRDTTYYSTLEDERREFEEQMEREKRALRRERQQLEDRLNKVSEREFHRRENEEIEELRSTIKALQFEMREKDQQHRLEVDRLRRKYQEVRAKNQQLLNQLQQGRAGSDESFPEEDEGPTRWRREHEAHEKQQQHYYKDPRELAAPLRPDFNPRDDTPVGRPTPRGGTTSAVQTPRDGGVPARDARDEYWEVSFELALPLLYIKDLTSLSSAAAVEALMPNNGSTVVRVTDKTYMKSNSWDSWQVKAVEFESFAALFTFSHKFTVCEFPIKFALHFFGKGLCLFF